MASAIAPSTCVTADDLLDRNGVTARHDASSNASGVDPRVARADEEHPHEVPCDPGPGHEVQLVVRIPAGHERLRTTSERPACRRQRRRPRRALATAAARCQGHRARAPRCVDQGPPRREHGRLGCLPMRSSVSRADHSSSLEPSVERRSGATLGSATRSSSLAITCTRCGWGPLQWIPPRVPRAPMTRLATQDRRSRDGSRPQT